MDYEKKYKDLLDKAKKLHDENWDECKVCLESLFPELAESEDERIRKKLIKYFQDLKGGWFGNISHDDILAWLEKQGRDKEINNFEILPGLYKCIRRMFDGTSEGRLLFEVGNIYKCLSKHDRAEFETSYGHSIYLVDPAVRKHFIPFKKQEKLKWSEEDSLMIDSIIDTMKWLEGKGATNMKIDWLRSLKQRMEEQL